MKMSRFKELMTPPYSLVLMSTILVVARFVDYSIPWQMIFVPLGIYYFFAWTYILFSL